MSSYVPQSVLQGLDAPDLIYTPYNKSVYFTRPGLTTATQSYSRFYGYDHLTHLPRWDRESQPPAGTNLTKLADGVFAGWLAKPWEERRAWPYAQRLTTQKLSTHVNFSANPRYAFDQGSAGLSDILRSRQWEMFTADKPDLRNREGVTSGHARTGSHHIPSDSIRAGLHHHPGQPPASYPKDSPPNSVHSRLRANFSGERTPGSLPAYKALMEGLDQFYSQGLQAKTGHRFDDVDDDVIIAYAKAHTPLFDRRVPEVFATIRVGEESNRGRHPNCFIPVPYLGQHYKYLDVILPLNPGYLRYLSNDILRLLHVHLAAFDCGAFDNFPMRAAVTDMVESRRHILGELESRGFTERLPHVTRLQGLSPSKRSTTVSDSWLMPRDRPPISMALAGEASQHGAAGKATAHNDKPNDQSRGHARSRSQQTRRFSSGEMSAKKKKRKGKAPVEKEIDEVDGSDQSEGMITPSASMLPSRAESVLGLDPSKFTDDKTRGAEESSPEGTGKSSEPGSPKTPESDEDYVPESYSDMAGEVIRHALRK